jgi:hypothetical protein
MTSKSAKSASQTSFAAMETPGTLHSLLVASGSPPPSAMVYAVPEFICRDQIAEVAALLENARSPGGAQRQRSPT